MRMAKEKKKRKGGKKEVFPSSSGLMLLALQGR